MVEHVVPGSKQRTTVMLKVPVGDLFVLVFPSDWNETQMLDSVCVYQRVSLSTVTCRVLLGGEAVPLTKHHPVTNTPFDARSRVVPVGPEVSARWDMLLRHGLTTRVFEQAKEYLP